MIADFHSLFARWKNFFSQLLNVHGFNDVSSTEIHTTDPRVHQPSAFEFELDIEKLKSHKSPDIGQIRTEWFKAGGRIIRYETH